MTVDAAVLSRSAGVLREHLDRTRDVRAPLNPNTRAFYTLALTRADEKEMARAFALAERRETLGPEGKALLLLAVQGSGAGRQPLAPSDPRYRALVNDLTGSVTISAAAAHWDDAVSAPGRLTTATRTTALALWALVRADANGPLVDQSVRWLMNERREGRWASTQESALAVMALGAVAELRQEGNASYMYRVTLNEATIREAEVKRAADAPAREILSADGSDTPLTKVKAGDLVKVRVTVLASGAMNYVQVDDYLPAGLEAVDTGLRTTAREELRGAACRIAFRACFSPFTHAEIRDDRLALFARELPKGAHEYVYFARATTAGTYQVRPSRAAEVYFPDVWGRTDSGVLVVE
jgi:uncharacterized protein YfaS (alpha-2-macroglobulin family)